MVKEIMMMYGKINYDDGKRNYDVLGKEIMILP